MSDGEIPDKAGVSTRTTDVETLKVFSDTVFKLVIEFKTKWEGVAGPNSPTEGVAGSPRLLDPNIAKYQQGRKKSSLILDMFDKYFKKFPWYKGLRGFGFVIVDCDKAEEIIKAAHDINGKCVGVRMTIFVGELPSSVTKETFGSFFFQFGNVVMFEIVRLIDGDHESLGGFIIFDREEVADSLLAKGRIEFIDGSQVVIKKAELFKYPKVKHPPYDKIFHAFFGPGEPFGSLDDNVLYLKREPLKKYPIFRPRYVESRSEELTVRVLCPSDKIGRVIAEGKYFQKDIHRLDGVQVEINDLNIDVDEYVITITSNECIDFHSPGHQALVLLHIRLFYGTRDSLDRASTYIRLLLPSKFISTFQENKESIEELTQTKIYYIEESGKPPFCGAEDYELVEVYGHMDSVERAYKHIFGCLRYDLLRDRDDSCSDSGRCLGHNSLQDYERFPASTEVVIPEELMPIVFGENEKYVNLLKFISRARVKIDKLSGSERRILISGSVESQRCAIDTLALHIHTRIWQIE